MAALLVGAGAYAQTAVVVASIPPIEAPAEQTEGTPEGADGPAPTTASTDLSEDALKVPSRTAAPPIADARPLKPEDDLIARAWLDGEGHLAIGPRNQPRRLTIDVPLQNKLTAILRRYQTPYGAVVALDPKTGRVWAMAEHSEARPDLRGLAVKAIFPAASVFKLVTTSALLVAGLTPETTECSHGGKRKLTEAQLKDSEDDHACLTLSDAFAFSANAIFAKLTSRHLTADALRTWAERFHFNRPIDFAEPTEPSLCAVPPSGLPLAKTGAGFGDVFLSPLHGAAIAAMVANRGLWRDPVLFADMPLAEPTRVMDEDDAAALVEMMAETVKVGTARRVFHERGFQLTDAAGKTGTLADKRPFRDYSWFVGFAPKDDPKVAVAAVIVNDYDWRIRASWLGREAMRLFLEAEAKKARAAEKAMAAELAATKLASPSGSDAPASGTREASRP